MSGTRYGECPRCKHYVKSFDDSIKFLLKDYYGKVSAEEYEALRKKLQKTANPFVGDQSVRYDYEASLEGNELKFYAYATCEVCGLTGELKDSVPCTNQSRSEEIFEEKIAGIREALNLPRPE